MRALFALALAPALLEAQFKTRLEARTSDAFDAYVRKAEAALGGPWKEVGAGRVEIESWGGKGPIAVPGGIIHDWVSAIFVSEGSLQKALAVLQDYSNYKNFYQPEVLDSRLLERDGNQFRAYLRLKKKKVLTVVLDTEYDVLFEQASPAMWRVISRSSNIAEVDQGRQLEPGTGHGFLWRLNSYWILEQRKPGLYLECRAISLSRDIPAGLAWAIKPMVSSLPRESLRATLEATSRALR